MELRIWRRFYLSPFVRLNIYTKGFTVSFGHRGIGWITFGRRGVRAITGLHAYMVFAFLKENGGATSQRQHQGDGESALRRLRKNERRRNFQTRNVVRKKKLHPIADKFSDDEMKRVKRFGQALGGQPTPFDEVVERHLQEYQRAREANAAKMRKLTAALNKKVRN